MVNMELCFVINLTKDGNWAITRPPIFATGYVSFATTFLYQVASTCYLQVASYLLQKKLISNTESCTDRVEVEERNRVVIMCRQSESEANRVVIS